MTAFLVGVGATAFVLLDEGPDPQAPGKPDLAGVEPVFREVADPYPTPVALTRIPKDCGLQPGTLAELVPKARANDLADAMDGPDVHGCSYASAIPTSEWGYQRLLLGQLLVTVQSKRNEFDKPSAAEAVTQMSLERTDRNRSWQEVTGLGDEALVEYDEISSGGEVKVRHSAVLINVSYSGRVIPKGSGALYSKDELDEKPAVEGALRAARDVAAAIGAKVADVRVGPPPDKSASVSGQRDACTLVTDATLRRLSVSAAPNPIAVSSVAVGAVGGTCLWHGSPRLEIDTGVLPDTVDAGSAAAAHRGYLDRYHHVREGSGIDTLDRPSLRFRTLSGLGDESFVYSYTAHSKWTAGGAQQCGAIFFRLRNALTEITYCADLPEADARAGVSLVASDAAAALAS
ncbi:hypothetical protein [Nonomuraea maritima]|uniref:hypothetical protein n=1 Tax=Nonomuraea maritima TaxID=683260 RepID=UPI003722C355